MSGLLFPAQMQHKSHDMFDGDNRLDILGLHVVHPALAHGDLKGLLEGSRLQVVIPRDAVHCRSPDWHLRRWTGQAAECLLPIKPRSVGVDVKMQVALQQAVCTAVFLLQPTLQGHLGELRLKHCLSKGEQSTF